MAKFAGPSRSQGLSGFARPHGATRILSPTKVCVAVELEVKSDIVVSSFPHNMHLSA